MSAKQSPQTVRAHEPQSSSLFVVSLPRSLSTLIYHLVREAAGLREPAWTSDGEILNLDRFVLYPGPSDDTSRKFITPEIDGGLFESVTEFLEQVAAPEGFAYKDVVQPFIVAKWLAQAAGPLRVIRIKRNVVDVAYAMLTREWFYPGRLRPEMRSRYCAVVHGLVLAEQALDAIPGEHLDYDRLIEDERPLGAAIERLYPGLPVKKFKYINRDFEQMRKHVLERRKADEYATLAAYAAQARKEEMG